MNNAGLAGSSLLTPRQDPAEAVTPTPYLAPLNSYNSSFLNAEGVLSYSLGLEEATTFGVAEKCGQRAGLTSQAIACRRFAAKSTPMSTPQ